jgi:ribonuclease P protein component
MKPFGFSKKERLCSKKSIDTIFAEGRSVFSYPIKAAYTIETIIENEPPSQVLFVVPKKKFKRAVHRNAIRRRMREAFRLNKQLLNGWCLSHQKQVKISFIYVASEQLKYDVIQKAMINTFEQISRANG